MKEFDIENLKRETIFKTPDGFFEDMQKKVLQETIPVKQGKIIKLNWAYSAAAAVALLVGVSVVMNSDPGVEGQSMTQVVPADSSPATYTLSEVKPQKEEAVALKILEEDLTSVAQTHQKRSTEPSSVSPKKTASFANQKELKTTQNPEVQVDQILANFTTAELATVGRNTEQDIYLDLYN